MIYRGKIYILVGKNDHNCNNLAKDLFIWDEGKASDLMLGKVFCII